MDLKGEVIKPVFMVGLTILDMLSDLGLAIDYYSTGKDPWYFALTLTFVLFPTVIWAILGLMTSMRGCTCKEPNIKRKWLQWKTFESIVESGPQLILQLYIMALPNGEQKGIDKGIRLKVPVNSQFLQD